MRTEEEIREQMEAWMALRESMPDDAPKQIDSECAIRIGTLRWVLSG